MKDLRVEKRNRTYEKFNKNKIYDLCRKIGLSEEDSLEIVKEVIEHFLTIPSKKIKRYLVKRIKKRDKTISDKLLKYELKNIGSRKPYKTPTF